MMAETLYLLEISIHFVKYLLFYTGSEILERSILHWNYKGLKTFPAELMNYGKHVEEIYLKVRQYFCGESKNLEN